MQNSNSSLPTIEQGVHTIEPEQVGTRLDRYLTTLFADTSRTTIQQLISEGEVLINSKQSKPGYALRLHDTVEILRTAPTPAPQPITPVDLPLEIIYEDEDLLIVNKPAGMVVHPAPGHYDDTLVNVLVDRYPELQANDQDQRPGIVHRLDKDTSGVLIVAKNLRTHAAFVELMKGHAIEKRYLALVEGVVSLDNGRIDAPIGRDLRNRQQMTITTVDSRDAITHFRVKQRFSRHTLLLLQLETGRTHQIRVHLKAIGHPVVGDPTYGSGRVRPGIDLKRQFLHAYQLRFTHPFTGQIIEAEAPMPADLQTLLSQPNIL